MSNRSTLLLEHHLKELRLPTFLSITLRYLVFSEWEHIFANPMEYRKLAAQCAQQRGEDEPAKLIDHPDYLLRSAAAELELIDRHQRMVPEEYRSAAFVRAAFASPRSSHQPGAPVDFLAIPAPR